MPLLLLLSPARIGICVLHRYCTKSTWRRRSASWGCWRRAVKAPVDAVCCGGVAGRFGSVIRSWPKHAIGQQRIIGYTGMKGSVTLALLRLVAHFAAVSSRFAGSHLVKSSTRSALPGRIEELGRGAAFYLNTTVNSPVVTAYRWLCSILSPNGRLLALKKRLPAEYQLIFSRSNTGQKSATH